MLSRDHMMAAVLRDRELVETLLAEDGIIDVLFL
jgi:hypothetical protein